MTAPIASIVVPAYNVASTIRATVESALAQTYESFEVVVVDDGSTDETPEILAAFDDQRLRVVRQMNRGLAGARNGGIAAARGRFIGFLDGDDLWEPEKLAVQVAHLEARPEVGVCYSASAMIDANDKPLGLTQSPKLSNVTSADILRRNPVGNGSAAVIRRETFDAIAWRPQGETERDWWFDETFRQSEDIECWMRIALTTEWRFEGVAAPLTLYRINPDGLSANLDRQHETWERMLSKVAALSPGFAEAHGAAARAYQFRYLARRAVASCNGRQALSLIWRSLQQSHEPLFKEPVKTLTTLAAALALSVAGGPTFAAMKQIASSALRRVDQRTYPTGDAK